MSGRTQATRSHPQHFENLIFISICSNEAEEEDVTSSEKLSVESFSLFHEEKENVGRVKNSTLSCRICRWVWVAQFRNIVDIDSSFSLVGTFFFISHSWYSFFVFRHIFLSPQHLTHNSQGKKEHTSWMDTSSKLFFCDFWERVKLAAGKKALTTRTTVIKPSKFEHVDVFW